MSTVRLSARQEAALLALLDLGTHAGGDALATQMRSNGRAATTAAAHQAADGLYRKGLAIKSYRVEDSHRISYALTSVGREAAAKLRGAS